MKNLSLYINCVAFCLSWLCVSETDMAVIPPKAPVEEKEPAIVEIPNDPNAIQMNEGEGAGQKPDVKEEENVPQDKDKDLNDTGERKDQKDKETEGDESDGSSAYESYEDKNDKKLKFEAEPPEHWDGVRLERNGKINAEIEQELFLGPDHDEFESVPEEVGKQKLMEIFKLVDLNGDAKLSLSELIEWITLKTNEHLKEAVEGSRAVFPKVDTDGDGKLTWDEYTIQFLKQRGYNKHKIEKFKQGKSVLQEHDEEDNAIYRDRWQTADENEDDILDAEEFISFMHPEHSERMLNIVVEEILHELDQDGDALVAQHNCDVLFTLAGMFKKTLPRPAETIDQDGDKKLTLAEFVSVPLSRERDLGKMEKEDEWIRGRREEYETRIDLDKNGVATFDELKAYMDPKNKQHAEGEARHLMGVADDNNDQLLSAQEVLGNYYVFIGSKVYNYARNVHDEF